MRAEDVKPIDGGKGTAFGSKSFEIKDQGEIAVVLSFEAGKEVTIATKGDRETDVHLMLKSKYLDYKDTSPTPVCVMKFTPVTGDEKFTITLKNQGPGANKVTLAVKVGE